MKNLEDLAKFPSENPNPVLRVNKEFVLYANQIGQDLFNIKIGDRIPILLRDVIHKSFEENVTQNIEVALNHHFYSLFVTPIKGANYVNIYGMDITERKRAEQNLKESEAKWRAITEYSPDHILMMDKDAKILFINYTVPDLTVDEVIGRDYYDFVQKEFEESQRKHYKEVMETGTPRLFETGYVDKDGNQFYFDVHSAPIWKEGKVIGIINRSNDITARKKRDEEIRLHSEIMTNLSEGVYLIRLEDLIIVYTNPRFEQMFGYDPGELIGKYVVIVNAPTNKTPEETKNEIVGILKETGEWHGEVLNIKKDGTRFWCYANVSLFDHPEHGRVIVAVHTDITDRKRTELKLKQSEENYRELYESAPNTYLSIKPDKTIIRCNNAAVKLLGYSKEELIGMNILEIYSDLPEGLPKAKKLFKKFLEGQSIQDEELQMKHKNGNPIWISLTVEAVKNQEGLIIESRSMVIDITSRKLIEEELRENERLLKNAQELAHIGHWKLNPLTKEVSGSEELFKIFNLTHEVATLEKFLEVVHPEDREMDLFHITRGIETGESWDIEHRVISKDGKVKWVHAIGRAKKDDTGKVLLVFGTAQDITEQKRAEQKLEESEEKYRLIFESANDGISILDLEGNFYEVNDLYCTRLGFTREELLKSNIRDINVPEFADLVSDRIVDIKEKRFNVFESAHKTKDGRIIPVEISAKSIVYENKPAILSIVRDITERKSAEIELQKSETTYREAYNRAEFYKDIFTHDINNILQNISNGIQLNEMYLNKPDKLNAVKRNIAIIKSQVKRGANLVSNVRKLSKITESEVLLFNVNCIEVLKKSINYIKNTFHDKNLKINIQISDDKFKILANELLEDVFDNILTNSINYNDSEFINIEIKVTKELRQGINYIKFQFSDNGIGITDERKTQIFIRGYSEKTSVHGMGLGLSLVKKIIESYNGEIWMEDRVKDDYTKGNICVILILEVVNND